MEENERLTKKELKLKKKLESLEKEKEANKQSSVTRTIVILAIIVFILLFAGIAFKKSGQKNLPITNLTSAGWTIGSDSAKINLIEYSDFQCPACRAYEPFVKQALQDLNGAIKFTYKYFPLIQVHKNALISAKAAEAAGRQGKFWEMHDLLFEKQDEWAELSDPTNLFTNYAKSLNLNVNKFEQDLTAKEVEQKVQENLEEAINTGLNSTPSFILNGKIISPPANYQDFKALLEKN